MGALNFEDTSHSMLNAVLATKVSKALGALGRGKADASAFAALHQGKDLVEQIVSGSALIERRAPMGGIAPSASGLEAFSHALTALHQLKRQRNHDFTEVFLSLRTELASAADGKLPPPGDLEALRGFFRTLAQLFQQDVRRESEKQPAQGLLLT